MYDLFRMSATPNPRTILRKEEVLRRTGLKTTRLYELIKNGEFPAQISIGARAVGWHEDEVQDWIRERPAVEGRRRRSLEGPQDARPDGRAEHIPPSGVDEEFVAPPDSARDDAPDQARKHKTVRRSISGASTGRQDAVAATSDACEPDEVRRLRVENSRLKILIANLILENDALRSATAGITAA